MTKLSCAFAVALASLLPSCASDDWGPEELSHGSGTTQAATLRRGRESYEMYCAGCHGETGDGEGPAARHLDPKPRDLRKARVKFASVAAGSMPRDEDLLRTITHGLDGTSMPAWNLIPRDEQLAVVAYIKTLSPAWSKGAPGAAVAIKADPFRKHPEDGVALGERVYHGLAACSSCHPAYATHDQVILHMKSFDIPYSGFREHMYESVAKESDWGAPIRPPDFLTDRVKSGTTREDLVRVIAAGVGGTAMPSWGTSLPADQLWGLAYYVESLVSLRGTRQANELRQRLAEQPTAGPAPSP
jgi:mono/diheme cytochrome c family protein